MDSEEIRKKFLEFFSAKGGSASGGEKRGHKIVPSSSLVPENDPSVLLTTAGMQQFKPYYLGKKSPYGLNVASCQKCFRTSDIDSVGDESHLTFFEMLGNFSFGGYYKKKAIEYAHEFITKKLHLKIDYVSVFGGDKENNLLPDEESEKIWREIDGNIRVEKMGKKDNFWGPTGDEGPCGPTSEIYINGIEIWNLVFNEYYRKKDGKFTKLETPGVDTGMGLERLIMVAQNKMTIFETDLFDPFRVYLISGNVYHENSGRIISDHLRGSVFLLADGIKPSNKEAGYILRRLLRRIIVQNKKFGFDSNFIETMIENVIKKYGDFYPELKREKENILDEFRKEANKFNETLEIGLKEFYKKYPELKAQILKAPAQNYKTHERKHITGKDAFDLYQTFGFPPEVIKDLAKDGGHIFDNEGFNIEFKKHQELSRTASAGMFKGGLADASEATIKYHTAAHLMLAALRQVLGKQVSQKGSNITSERLRFDFSYDQKMTSEEIKQVENLVNNKIKEDLPVEMEEMTLEEAKVVGATGAFESKYGERVKVYSINNFSKEICGGPHVEHTGKIGKFKIIKEESSSAGIRRIRATIE